MCKVKVTVWKCNDDDNPKTEFYCLYHISIAAGEQRSSIHNEQFKEIIKHAISQDFLKMEIVDKALKEFEASTEDKLGRNAANSEQRFNNLDWPGMHKCCENLGILDHLREQFPDSE